MALTLGALVLVPTLGIARFDVFGAEHRALGKPADALHGLIAVLVAIFLSYLVTFQVNLVAGRMFCGWGCPIGQLNRLSDAFDSARKRKEKLLWGATFVLFAVALSVSLLLWWMPVHAFWTPPGGWLAVGTLGLATAGALAFGKGVGWTFCRKACPIGLYYSVVQQKRPLGILYEEDACLDEGVCQTACPVDLDPRNLPGLKNGIGGLAIDGLTAHSHCLRCGACVEACELVTTKLERPALLFGRTEGRLSAGANPGTMGSSSELVPMPRVQHPPRAEGPGPGPGPGVERPALPAQAASGTRPSREKGGWARFFRTADHGIWGSGLSPFLVLLSSFGSVTVFLLFDGWLGARATGESHVARFVAAAVSASFLVFITLLVTKRLTVSRWVVALGMVLAAVFALVVPLFVVLSPGSASQYQPARPWEVKKSESAPKPRRRRYRSATGPFPFGTVQGRVTHKGQGVPGAWVYLETPPPGRRLGPSMKLELVMRATGFSSPLYVARQGSVFRIRNDDDTLHTLEFRFGNRVVRNVPLPPSQGPRKVPWPAPRLYDLGCASHPSERARLLVLDHPYSVQTDLDGAFKLTHVPVGVMHAAAVSGDLGTETQQIDVLSEQSVNVGFVLESHAP